ESQREGRNELVEFKVAVGVVVVEWRLGADQVQLAQLKIGGQPASGAGQTRGIKAEDAGVAGVEHPQIPGTVERQTRSENGAAAAQGDALGIRSSRGIV